MTQYQTFDEIVDIIFEELNDESKRVLRETAKDDLVLFHHTTGRAIRNDFLLWDPNNPITAEWERKADPDGVDRSPHHPDAISMRIIERVWEKVNGE